MPPCTENSFLVTKWRPPYSNAGRDVRQWLLCVVPMGKQIVPGGPRRARQTSLALLLPDEQGDCGVDWKDAGRIVVTALFSVGSGGALVVAVSSRLGKMWADRLMEKERDGYTRDLEKLRADLRQASNEEMARMRNDLDIFKLKHIRGHEDRLHIYRLTVDVVVDILGDLNFVIAFGDLSEEERRQRWDRFNRDRMRVYGYLGMLAPQTVMDTCDGVFDYLIQVLQNQKAHEWPEVRKHALAMLNAMRVDIGIDTTSVEYRGIL